MLFRAKEKMIRPIRRLEHLVLEKSSETESSPDCSTPAIFEEGVARISYRGDGTTGTSGNILRHDHRHSHIVEPVKGDEECKDRGETPKSLEKKTCKLPKLSAWNNLIVAALDEEESKEKVERYLNVMLHFSDYRNHKETREFLEVSKISFVANLGPKEKEGIVKKRPGGRRSYHGIMRCCIEYFAAWTHRYILASDLFCV
ncbi:unnamed protein product [Soboliphyme baturini]|uniref:Nuclear cap-binding protein subunit 3 n=1 Tax=Soboliphyme baturini TaxID=241478 RepID=A0A183JAC3_9BILA|nr:unnamed protein product [Soboliphyme baturini]